MEQINYVKAREEFFKALKKNSFIDNISIINYWNFYGRYKIRVGYTDNTRRIVKEEFKIVLKEDSIDYYIGVFYLGTIHTFPTTVIEIKAIVKTITGHIIQQTKASYSKKSRVEKEKKAKKKKSSRTKNDLEDLEKKLNKTMQNYFKDDDSE